MGYNRKTFAVAVLQQLGYRPTPENVRALVGWSRAEGGNWNNSASYNPLNTTLNMPGAHPINSVGVKAYGSWDQGIRATVKTLRNGNYGGILGALKHGQSAGAVAQAIGNSPWGTSASLIDSVIGATPRINVGGIRVPQGGHGGGSVTVRTSSPGMTSHGLSVPAPDLSGLSSLLSQQQAPQLPYASPLGAPSFSAQKYVPGGGGITSYGPQQPAQTGSSLADALASIGQSVDPSLSGIKYPGSSQSVTLKGGKGAATSPGGSGKFSAKRIDGLKLATPKAAWNPYNKPMAPWLADALSWARQHGWQGTVSSGYRTAAEQTAAAGHYGLQHYPNGPQASNHRTGNAVDVDPTHARQLANILRRYPGKKPIWGGPVMGDWVHFSNNGH